MLKKLIKVPKEILIPSVCIILSAYVLVARAVWIDVVTPATIISAADWNQMAIVLADLDNKATQLEGILPGLLCGRTVRGSSLVIRNCFTSNPEAGCPSGFTQVGGQIGTGGRSVWTCVKNP